MNLYGWEKYLDDETLDLAEHLFRETNEMRSYENVFPPQEQVFRALSLTQPENVKVVILGQDPYHGMHQATGLSFSVNEDCKIPPSLRNIFKEYEADLNKPAPQTGDLTHWAQQGVLMLNATLTVEEKSPQSHAKLGWNKVTSAILAAAFAQRTPSCHVALAWGMPAVRTIQKALDSLPEEDRVRTRVLKSTHPSPLSARNTKAAIPSFMGSRPFSQCNEILIANGVNPIEW